MAGLDPAIYATALRVTDLPAIRQLHQRQVIGEIPRRNLAMHLGERGVRPRAIDLHHPVVPRQIAGLRRLPTAHQLEPLRTRHVGQLAVLRAEQMDHLVAGSFELGRIALINPVEIELQRLLYVLQIG
jgi:hypothetical protein